MSASAPLLVMATVPADGKDEARLARLAHRLRRRGLKVETLRTLGDIPLGQGDYDILMVSCSGRQEDLLAKELEHAWTQRWNLWYSRTRGLYHD